jgi:hypothetical protein
MDPRLDPDCMHLGFCKDVSKQVSDRFPGHGCGIGPGD